MKKTKIILPIISATALSATITPIVTSCNKSNEIITLEEAKNLASLMVSTHEADAIARQPEAAGKIKAAANYLVGQIQKTDHRCQALGLAYNGEVCDAIARQPEASGKVTLALVLVTNLVLSQHNEKALALGGAFNTGSIYDAIARQPEAFYDIIQAYIEYADQVING